MTRAQAAGHAAADEETRQLTGSSAGPPRAEPTMERRADADRPVGGAGRGDERTPPDGVGLPTQCDTDGPPPATDPGGQPDARASRRWTMRRGTGALTAIVLILAALWVGAVPYLGPYLGFGYDASPLVDDPVLTPDRLWLTALPALAILVGGLILGPSRNRVTAASGAVSAIAGGAWLIVGPSISQLWGAPGPGRAIGAPIGGTALRVLDQLVVFYGVGVVVIVLAAFALGRAFGPTTE